MNDIKLLDIVKTIPLTIEDKDVIKQTVTTELMRVFLKFTNLLKEKHAALFYYINYNKDKETLLKNQYILQGQMGIINEFQNFLHEALKKEKGDKDDKKKV